MADDWGNDPLVTPEKPKKADSAPAAHDDWGNDKLITPTAKLMASQLEERPRWDLPGDISRVANENASALASNVGKVAGVSSKQDIRDSYEPIYGIPGTGIVRRLGEEASRLGALTSIPLNALGAITAPITGAIHAVGGSLASYLPFETKASADSAIDTALMGARPAGAPVAANSLAPRPTPSIAPVNALSPEAMASAAGTVPIPMTMRPGTLPPRPFPLSPEGLEAAGGTPRTAETAQNSAVREIVQRLDQSGLTAEQILARHAKAPDKPLTLADLGGQPVQSLAGNVYRSGGEAKQISFDALSKRDMAAGERTTADVRAGISDGGTKYANEQALMKARSTAAAPLYDQAFSVPIAFNDRLAQFTADPILKAGLAQGVKLQRLEALADGKPFSFQDYRIKAPPNAQTPGGGNLGDWLEGANSIEFEGVPNLRTLDAGKRGLDAIVEANTDKVTGKVNQYGRAVDQVRRAFVKELDKATTNEAGISPYAQARAAWSGPSASMDAMNRGRQILQTNPEKIADDIKRLSPGDQEFYRLGAADRLIEAIAKKGKSADEAKVIIGNDWTQSQIRPLFADQSSFDRFIGRVEAESQMHDTKYKVAGNSMTAEREAEDVNGLFQAIGSALHTGHQAMNGNWFAMARGVGNTMRALGDLRRDPGVNAEIARMIYEPIIGGDKPSGSMKLLQNWMSYKDAQAAQVAQRASSQQNFMRQYARQQQGVPPAGPQTSPVNALRQGLSGRIPPPHGEARAPMQSSPVIREVDPKVLIKREADQNRLADVRSLFPRGEGYNPIVTITERNGSEEILDGHNRASVAEERGDKIPVVSISREEYRRLRKLSYDDMEISYAALSRAGDHDAAASIDAQFPGSKVSRRGEEARADLEDLHSDQP